ncbi:MAG: TIGR03435 family protein, partial [Acidobacteria bacterium]
AVKARHVLVVAAPPRPGEAALPIELDARPPSAHPMFSSADVEALFPWLVSTWLIGVALLLARATAGWWRVRRLHQRALRSVSSRWQSAGNRIAVRLGLARVIRIVELPQIDVPFVVGCLRPIVVLPIAAISQLSVAQVEAILAHELAHVRRHDYLVNLMQTLAETLFFYHPAVWWISARIRDEREHCCDDVAVDVCGDAVGYAAALTELEAWRSSQPALAPAATDGSLLHRVRRILEVETSNHSYESQSAIGVVLAVTLLATVTVFAQTLAEQPKFEVASVRPNTSADTKMTIGAQPGGRFNAVNAPLAMLIRSAYRLQDFQLVGGPEWISTDRFDIVAKAEREFPSPVPGGPPSAAQMMLRSLLEERFKLVVRRETREMPIYALVRARDSGKLGPELRPSTVDCEAFGAARRGGGPAQPPKAGERPVCSIRMGFGELAGGGFPLSSLASSLVGTVQRTVVDKTGLSGNFDFYVRWTPDRLPQRPAGTPADQPFRMNGLEIDPNGPSIFTALQEQLGLKLDAQRGPVEVLVIDRVERPTPD